MKFRYIDGIKTVEQAVEQGIAAAAGPAASSTSIQDAIADALLQEIQTILAGELSSLRDEKGVAKEWNSALEVAIELVRGELP